MHTLKKKSYFPTHTMTKKCKHQARRGQTKQFHFIQNNFYRFLHPCFQLSLWDGYYRARHKLTGSRSSLKILCIPNRMSVALSGTVSLSIHKMSMFSFVRDVNLILFQFMPYNFHFKKTNAYTHIHDTFFLNHFGTYICMFGSDHSLFLFLKRSMFFHNSTDICYKLNKLITS